MRAQSKAKIMANACKIKIFEAAIAGWYRVRVTILCTGTVTSTAVHTGTGTSTAVHTGTSAFIMNHCFRPLQMRTASQGVLTPSRGSGLRKAMARMHARVEK